MFCKGTGALLKVADFPAQTFHLALRVLCKTVRAPQNQTKKQPKNCQNIVKEAEIFWLFKKMPSAPACPAACACKPGSRFFRVLHATSKRSLLPRALCSRDSTGSPVLHRETRPWHWHRSANVPSLNKWSQPYRARCIQERKGAIESGPATSLG